jgi:hypothetical protein
MSEVNRELLTQLMTARIRDRVEARRRVQPEAVSLYRQAREEKLRILEQAAQKATGTDLRELRASLARNRKDTHEALASLRPASVTPQSTATAPGRLYHSLKPLAGRLVPLAQPSFVFLDTPDAFDSNETGNWVWNSSIAPGDAFFQTDIHASSDSDQALYIFTYSWHNDSDTSMLTTLFTGITFTGWLTAAAQNGSVKNCWDAAVSEYLYGALLIGATNEATELRSSNFGSITARNGMYGLGDGLAEQLYNDQEYGISIEGYLVPPNSKLTMLVAIEFNFSWGFDTPVSPAENWAEASFGNKLFTQNRIVSNGIVLFASPVQIQ